MGAFGAALATVIAQTVSVVLCIMYLKRHEFVFDFKLSSFRFHKERMKMLLKVGIPTSIQNVAVGVSFLFLTSLVNSISTTASAAVGAVGKLNGFAILPASAMSSSVSAMSAQNFGAGEMKRAKQTMVIGMLIAAAISYVIFFLVYMFPTEAIKIFNDDPQLLSDGTTYIKSFSFDYLIVPFVFCFNGLFIGSGHTTFSLINSMLSSVVLRIPVAYILGIVFEKGLAGIGVAAPIASGASLIVAFLFFLSGKWKKMIIVKNNEH